MILVILSIFLWYIATGIREGLTWDKSESFFGIPKEVYSYILVPFSFGLACFTMNTYLFLAIFTIFLFVIICREYLDATREQFLWWKIDYHMVRAIEGGIFFLASWIVLKDFWLLCALWLMGNYVYKRFMNKVMYNEWHKISEMKVFKLLGYDLPYSDWYYEYSLIPVAIYFLIILFI